MSGHAGRGVTSSLVTGVVLMFLAAGAAYAQSYTFTRLAGAAGGVGNLDGFGGDARFEVPWGIAQATDGTLYVACAGSGTIREIATTAEVRTLAGLPDATSGADGAGFAAGLYQPRHVAVDASGNLFVADATLSIIRKITPEGIATTVAGMPFTPGSANGAGRNARFTAPSGIAIDASNNLYVSEEYGHTIRKITPAGVVTTLAGGAGTSGHHNATGTAARFNRPVGLAVGPGGTVYVADTGNHVIRKVTPDGVVTALAGLAGNHGSADGSGTLARFSSPGGLAVDEDGYVYVADTGNHLIRVITPGGSVSTLAGDAGKPGTIDAAGTAARFWMPTGIVVDADGELHVTDQGSHVIRKITPAGVVSRLAGLHAPTGSTDGSGLGARFSFPSGVASDSEGNVFVADRANWVIRKISPAGAVTTLAGTAGLQGSLDGSGPDARFSDPIAVAVDASGNVYVADHGAHTIRKITSLGVVTTLAGTAYVAGDDDGPGGTAQFREPSDLTVDPDGNVYVTDSGNHTIRMVTATGTVSTLAGLAGVSGYTNGGGGNARFTRPWAIVLHGSHLFVGDDGNRVIRRITLPGGSVELWAGQPGLVGLDDGPAAEARFYGFAGLAVGAAGDLFATDPQFDVVRKISSERVVTTIGGPGTGSEDGTGPAARFARPQGIDVTPAGHLVIADTGNQTIRIGKPAFASAATVDTATGPVGVPRQLGRTGATAIYRRWRIARKPAGSSTALSSVSVDAPTFTPDRNDRYTFELFAIDGANDKWSITRVDFTAECSVDIAPESLSGPVVGVPYSRTLTGSGAAAPYTFGLTSGFLPEGLSLSAAGVLSGTPTTAGGRTFSVVAMDGNGCQGTRTYSIDVAPVGTPTGVVATAVSSTSVAVSWNPVAAAAGYRIFRRSGGGSFVQVGSTSGSASTSFTNTSVPANQAFLYVVRAIDAAGDESSDSNLDLATTVVFTDPVLTAAPVWIKAVHVEQLRIAIGAVLALGAQPAYPWSDPAPLAGIPIKEIHVTQLRQALNNARTALGFGTVIFLDSSLAGGVPVKGLHLMQLRDGVK